MDKTFTRQCDMQGGLQQAAPKSKLGAGAVGSSPTPLASLVASQTHPHPYPHGITVQSGAPSMVPPSHPKPIQTGPSADSFPASRASELARQSPQQVHCKSATQCFEQAYGLRGKAPWLLYSLGLLLLC